LQHKQVTKHVFQLLAKIIYLFLEAHFSIKFSINRCVQLYNYSSVQKSKLQQIPIAIV